MTKQTIYSNKGKKDCSHNWCNRAKIPETIRVSFCTVCGKERIEHDSAGTPAQVRDKVVNKGTEFSDLEVV